MELVNPWFSTEYNNVFHKLDDEELVGESLVYA